MSHVIKAIGVPEKYEAVSFDEFESIGIVNAKDKAARFYAVMFFSLQYI